MKDKLVAIGSFLCPGIILLTLAILLVFQNVVDMETEIPVQLRVWVGLFMVLQFLAVIGVWGVVVFDLIHIIKNPGFTNQQKLIWVLLLWLLNIFVIPIYWLKHLRETS